jgi:hypothetical protein
MKRSGRPSDLETDFNSAVRMAHIAATLMEDNLSNQETLLTVTGLPNTYYINAEDVDSMLYAIYETLDQIRSLRDHYFSGD